MTYIDVMLSYFKTGEWQTFLLTAFNFEKTNDFLLVPFELFPETAQQTNLSIFTRLSIKPDLKSRHGPDEDE